MIMRGYESGLAAHMEEFELLRKAIGRWGETYNDNLKYFDRYCRNNFPNETVLSEGMLEWCEQRPTEKRNSCFGRTSIVWDFVDHLRKLGLTDIVSKKPVWIRDESFSPHIFTGDELTMFFSECDRISIESPKKSMSEKLNALEYPVFYRLLFSTGMRTCEARWLRLSDIDFETGAVSIVKTKGGCQHRIALHPSMLDLLRRYIDAMRKLMPESILLFPDLHDKPHYTRWEFFRFNRIWSKISNEPARSYDFRHLFATTNIESMTDCGCELNGRLMFLSRYMGHTSMCRTTKYFHYVPILRNKIENLCGNNFLSVMQKEGGDDEE